MMKKFIRNVVITLIILGLICAAFYEIGWLTSWREVVCLYIITFIVIVVDKTIDIAVSKIRSHKKDE
jgi:hypothetical protein